MVGGYPGITIFDGYLDDREATARAVRQRRDDGFVWFDTGDRAAVDARGMIHFAGRHSDLLKVAGENVSVVEIEGVLAEHPGIDDVAVIGRADELRDEVPIAYVVATPHAPAWPELEASLRQWAADRLAPSKRPADFHPVGELPRTSVGKIRKFLLGGTEHAAPQPPTNQQRRQL